MDSNELLLAISSMMDQKLEPIYSRLDQMDSRLGHVEERLDQMDSRLGHVEERLDQVDSRLDQMDSRLYNVEKQLVQTEGSLRAALVESENLILEEVSRVHNILNAHRENRSIHMA
jgi:septal ring factor EnvC (AmiA/AmiB activator)